MTQRIDLGTVEPAAYNAMLELERYLSQCDLAPTLLHLIKMRASQINRCGFCINMHAKEARKAGETEQRLYALNAWQESPWFTLPEKVALALTEAVTSIGDRSIDDLLYQKVRDYFSEKEVAQILMAIVTINAWNRITIVTKMNIN